MGQFRFLDCIGPKPDPCGCAPPIGLIPWLRGGLLRLLDVCWDAPAAAQLLYHLLCASPHLTNSPVETCSVRLLPQAAPP